MRTYVIADIGACHDGSIINMIDAIYEAQQIGVSALKFQWTSDADRMARRRGAATEDGYAGIYAKYLQWPARWMLALAQRCRDAGLDFMCTAFLPEDVAAVAPEVARFKIASFEAEDPEMYVAHEPYGQPVIVSLGMGARAPEAAAALGTRLRFLRCTSSYPAPVESLGLRAIGRFGGSSLSGTDYGLCGFSDHSDPALTSTGAIAVAAGAEIVEAHLRLSTTRPENPDYPHAMTTEQFAEYVRHIRFAERCLGGDTAGLAHPSERPMARYRVDPINRLTKEA